MSTLRHTALLLGTFALIAGCDLFSTRQAESPDSARGTWEVPRVPEDVLSNMASALFERNAVNYMRSFDAESFSFEADNATLAVDPSLAGWDYADEDGHIRSLLAAGTLPQDSLLFVVFTSPQETQLGDSAEILTSYDLTAGIALAGAPGGMAGTAQFLLRMGSEGYWQIYRWRDTRTEDRSPWSDLKSLVRGH